MSEHEIGREIHDLRSRLERLEASSGTKPGCGCAADRGASHFHQSSGGVAETKPVEWKLEKGARFPPFLLSYLRIPLAEGLHFDAPPQSKTWGCTPEPLILIVNWSGGGSDEFFRLVNQTFSVIKWTNPNTGIATATASYSATIIASGRAKTIPGSVANFQLVVRATGGTPILIYTNPFSVRCDENGLFDISHQIDPGQFDLVSGATWSLSYSGISRC
jgi:hypothetical protein